MSPGNKQSQAPVREFSQPLVATSCPLQLFFAPQPVLRPILGQLSNFVTVLMCSAITLFSRAHGKSVYMYLGVEDQLQDKTTLCWRSRQYTNAYLQKNVHKLCSHWSSSAQSSCFLFTVRATFSLTGINMDNLL